MTNVLAIDIGGTHARYAIVNPAGTFVVHGQVRTDKLNIADTVEPLEAAVAKSAADEVGAVGIVVAGNLDDGVLTGSGNLPGWTGMNLVKWFGNLAPDKPVRTLNDCAGAALGEFVSHGFPLIYVGWGTGVGVGIVTGSLEQPVVTQTEFGHMVVDIHSDVQCGCGGAGHLEALTCGRYLAELCGGNFAELDEGDLHDATIDMAIGLRNISCAYPNLPIVLGGGVIEKQLQIFPELQRRVAQLKAPAPVPAVGLSSLSGDAGLIGAAHVARRLI